MAERFKVKDIEKALVQAGGIVSLAAKMLAAKTGSCAPNTVRGYIQRYPTLQAVVEHTVETNLDLAESKLLVALNQGAEWAIRFYLETKGKHRGYSKRSEITGIAGQPVQVVTNAGRNWLTDQLDQMAARLGPEPDGEDRAAAGGGAQPDPQKTVH